MKKKIVWITGASSGIGESLARECARLGATVILSARRAEVLEIVRKSCDRPGDHMTLPLDVTEEQTHAIAFGKIIDRYGSLDILINNSGISQRSRVAETPLDIERRIMDVNYFGVLSLTKTVLHHMIERDRGRIVVVSSVMGKVSTPGHATYAASKHALHGYFEGLRAELDGTGVGVTMICPGYVRTNISHHALMADGVEHGKMDAIHEKAMAPEICSRRIAKAIMRGKPEAHIGGIETRAILLNRLFPGLYRFLLPRVYRESE